MEGTFAVTFRFLGEREPVCSESIIMHTLNGAMVLFACMLKIHSFLSASSVVRSIHLRMWVPVAQGYIINDSQASAQKEISKFRHA